MALPIRERLLQVLATRASAERGLEYYDQRDLPFTVLLEGEDQAAEDDYDNTRVVTPVTVARALKVTGNKTDDWYEQANVALGDLIKEVYAGGEDLDGLADGIDYEGGSVEVITDGARGTIAQASFNIRWAFVHGDPFAQN